MDNNINNNNEDLEFFVEEEQSAAEQNTKVKSAINIKMIIALGAALLVLAVAVFFIIRSMSSDKKNKSSATPVAVNDIGNTDSNQAVSSKDDGFKFADNIFVNGVSVTGKTVTEAKSAIMKELSKSLSPVSLSVSANGKKYQYNQNDLVYKYNIDEVLKTAKQYSLNADGNTEKTEYTVTAEVDNSASVNKILNNLKGKVNRKATNSTFKVNKGAGNFSYTKGKNGYSLNESDLKNQLTEFIASKKQSGKITAKGKSTKPKITSNELKKNITLLSEFSTYSTNTANGNNNMRVSLKACNGSIIEPGETWSFNRCTGNSSLRSNGYLPATVISGGVFSTGIGGGLCQSSTTIYDAALYAGLGIAERHCHTYASTYCKEGLDASINYGSADLKIRNNSNYPVYLECYMSGTKLTARFYGRQSSDFDDIKLTSKRTSDLSGTYYTVSAARKWYKNGKLIRTEALTSSRYKVTSKSRHNSTTVSSKKKNTSSKKNVSSKKITSSKPTTSSKNKPTSSKSQTSSVIKNPSETSSTASSVTTSE